MLIRPSAYFNSVDGLSTLWLVDSDNKAKQHTEDSLINVNLGG